MSNHIYNAMGTMLITLGVFFITFMVAFGASVFIHDNNIGGILGSAFGTAILIAGITYGVLNYLYPKGIAIMGGYSTESSSSI
jgi:hypothetical protein